MEIKPELITALTFEVSLDLWKIKRTGYTVLDMLAQLGGITTVLVNSFRVIVSFFNYNNFVSYLASKFYQIKNSQLNDMTLSTPQAKLTASPLVTSKCGNLKELFMHKLLPKICVCRCCRLNKMQRGVAEARVALYKEINIP